MDADTTQIVQGITLGIALLGAVLGVINTWNSLSKSRVKLKVIPSHVIAEDSSIEFAIEITNLSAFPVTISDAGVLYHGTSARGALIHPIFSDGGQWPKRLEPRSSISIFSSFPYSTSGHRIKCAYAKTQCGYVKKGTSPALRQISKEQPI